MRARPPRPSRRESPPTAHALALRRRPHAAEVELKQLKVRKLRAKDAIARLDAAAARAAAARRGASSRRRKRSARWDGGVRIAEATADSVEYVELTAVEHIAAGGFGEVRP